MQHSNRDPPDPNNCSLLSTWGQGRCPYKVSAVLFTTLNVLLCKSLFWRNSLVILSILTFRQLRERLVNISVLSSTDLFLGILVVVLYVYRYYNCECWYLSHVACDWFNATDMWLCTNSIAHLCFISAERYVTVVKPLTYERLVTRKVLTMGAVGCWVGTGTLTYLSLHSHIAYLDDMAY